MGSYDDRPYPVGKGKPPKHTRWQAGQSGNPAGSSKKKRGANDMDLSELVRDLANQKVPVTIGGRTVWLSKKEMILLKFINDGIEGRATQRLKVIEFLCVHGVFDPVAQHAETEEAKEARISKLLEVLQREAERAEEMQESFPTR